MFLSNGYIRKEEKIMSFTRFKEYLNDKGDVQKKADIDGRADTGPSGKNAPKPPKAQTKGKNWKNFQVKDEAAQVEDGGNGTKPTPYMGPGTDPGVQYAADEKGQSSPVKGNYKDPLGQKGPKDLIYHPKTMDQSLYMKKLHDTTPEDTKTEQFLKTTQGMPTGKYAEYILKQQNPNGTRQVIETVEIIKQDELLIETLVRELKRKGGFEPLMSVILSQPETYVEIAARLANESKGKDVARQLAKAINEITAEPATDDIVPERPASRTMPRKEDSINSRGQSVVPEDNARRAKTIQGTPTEAGNILQSRKQNVMMRPEHNLIEALANYRAIRTTMKKLVD
jgi:hypothetical protein